MSMSTETPQTAQTAPEPRARPPQPPQPQPYQVHEEPHSEVHFSPARTVAIAIDGSEHSSHALDWALKNVIRSESDQVVLLNVRPFVPLPTLSYRAPFFDYGVYDPDMFDRMDEANAKSSHALLIDAAKQLKKHHVHVRAIALRGDPRDELVYKIEELKADVVVMGSRGLGTLSRAIMGSVSDHLAHHVKCPVIVTRMNR
ncbi:hypothetical protein BC831DRAFT_435507 [Entophlyctis helioformis]|nr:hypothetical protein BC831DRAFT_435507 [Entophlyctis helioformis]